MLHRNAHPKIRNIPVISTRFQPGTLAIWMTQRVRWLRRKSVAGGGCAPSVPRQAVEFASHLLVLFRLPPPEGC